MMSRAERNWHNDLLLFVRHAFSFRFLIATESMVGTDAYLSTRQLNNNQMNDETNNELSLDEEKQKRIMI